MQPVCEIRADGTLLPKRSHLSGMRRCLTFGFVSQGEDAGPTGFRYARRIHRAGRRMDQCVRSSKASNIKN